MAKAFVEDITTLSKEEWREKRKNGIGGSDVGTILGLNKYQSVFDIFYNKIGAKDLKTVSEKSQIAMEIGNRLEELVADIFQKHHPSMQVLIDNTMYQHDMYDFMLANIDRRLMLPDNTTAILECKTLVNPEEWTSTDFCKGIKGMCPLSYEYQVRHYMAVLDIDLAIIAGLNIATKELYVVYVMRDKEIENKMIAAESEFWQSVEARSIPTMSQQFNQLSTSIKANAFKQFYGAEKAVTYQIHYKDELDIFNEINELILKQQFYSVEVDKIKKEKEELAMQLFVICEKRLNKKPSRIELNNTTDQVTVNQYITVSDDTAVSFDVQKFVEQYNHIYHLNVSLDIDVSTAILLCHRYMADRMGEFMSVKDKNARMYFSKRKVKLKEDKKQHKK